MRVERKVEEMEDKHLRNNGFGKRGLPMLRINTAAKFKKLTSAMIMSLTFLFTSCGEDSPLNPDIPGVDGPTLTLNEDHLLVSVVFENLQLQGGLRFPIPEYDDSYIEISPDLTTGGALMAVNISLADIFENGNLLQLDEQKLPGGRNLPGVPSGSLPAVAFTIPEFSNMSIYLGGDVFGVFFPIDLGFDQQILNFRYHVGEKAVGNISLVGNDSNGENGGFLLLIDITNAIERQASKLIRKYN